MFSQLQSNPFSQAHRISFLQLTTCRTKLRSIIEPLSKPKKIKLLRHPIFKLNCEILSMNCFIVVNAKSIKFYWSQSIFDGSE